MGGIHLESVAVLAEVYTELGRYRSDISEELKLSKGATQRALKALDDYERAARKVLSGLEDAMQAIRRTTVEQNRETTYGLQRQIDEAQERLRRCQFHRSKIESALKEFDQQRAALFQKVEKEIPKAESLLMRFREHVDRYSN